MTSRLAVDGVVSRWSAAPSPGGLIGTLALLLSLLLAGGSALAIGGRVSLPAHVVFAWAGLFVFGLASCGVIYLLYGYISLRYEFSDRFLTIRWAHRRFVVDLETIQQIAPAIDRVAEHPGRWQSFWPGYYVGTTPSTGGPVQVVATLPLRRQLLVRSTSGQFAISPERPVLFVEEYGRLRRSLDIQHTGGFPTIAPGESAARLAQAGWTMQFPVIPRAAESPAMPGLSGAGNGPEAADRLSPPTREDRAPIGGEISPILRPLLLNDPLSLGLLAAGVLLTVVMVTFILIRYESLPSSIVLHWNVNGDPDRIGSPREIWILPIITGLVTLANFGLAWSIYTFDQFAARFLLAATCVVQLAAWIALITLIR